MDYRDETHPDRAGPARRMSPQPITEAPAWLGSWVADHEADLIAVRRDLHSHPELGWQEHRTTALLSEHLRRAGLRPSLLPSGTGLVCDIGSGSPTVALRADIDALPLPDVKNVPYRSTVDGVCHACGHDVHTTVALGAALALHAAPELPGRVRMIFQPAEEQTPGGALGVMDAGALDGVDRIFALHCDPATDVGRIGVRTGAITAASDSVEVTLSGPGGHTARPHLTVDLVYAMGRLITDLPGLLTRVVDPRASLSLVWGAVQAGVAPNAIPQSGQVRGTVRMLDRDVWADAEKLVRRLVEEIVAPTGAVAEVNYQRGVPPVINESRSTALIRDAVRASLGPQGLVGTPQSLGGEDFGWYLDTVPGALARLGVRGGREPGDQHDLHQGDFDVDERAIAIGVRLMSTLALISLSG
jgi:amidohydrolase